MVKDNGTPEQSNKIIEKIEDSVFVDPQGLDIGPEREERINEKIVSDLLAKMDESKRGDENWDKFTEAQKRSLIEMAVGQEKAMEELKQRMIKNGVDPILSIMIIEHPEILEAYRKNVVDILDRARTGEAQN